MRLYIICEGQTEDEFVRSVLGPYLVCHATCTASQVIPILVGRAAKPKNGPVPSGGGGHWGRWKKDIEHLLRSQKKQNIRVTTLFDLYGLPNGFPGLEEHGQDRDTNRRCELLERSLYECFEDSRFIPYLQRHEFEALVLAALPQLRDVLEQDHPPEDLEGLSKLEGLLKSYDPEDINDGKESAPSKRLEATLPFYDKPFHGPLAVESAGLPILRERCPRFDAWLATLECL